MVGFWGSADRTVPFPVVSGSHFVNSHGHIFQPHFKLCMYTDRPYFALGLYKRLLTHTSDTTGDWTLISHVRYKEKERKGRFGEISEKITREDRGVCAFVWF